MMKIAGVSHYSVTLPRELLSEVSGSLYQTSTTMAMKIKDEC